MKLSNLLLAAFVISTFPLTAEAKCGKDIAYKGIGELPTFSGAPATGDFIPVCDTSENRIEKMDASNGVFGGAFNGTVGATTPAAGAFTTIDGTDIEILTGDLTVGNGTPSLTQNGEDGYIEGTFEVDGATRLDSTLAVAGAATLSGDITGDGGDQLVGYLQNQVASTTTGITAAQCGSTFVSNSADVMTLPEASTVLGCRLTFVCGTADDFDINPADGTDTITSVSTTNGTTGVVTLAPSAGDAIRCTDIGGSITLEAVGANAWSQVGGGNGIWTDVN